MRKTLLFLPGPVTVAEPVLAAMSLPLINHRGEAFAALQERVCGRLRPIFGTEQDVILLGSSGTGAMESVLVSLFSPGDRLLAAPVGVFGMRFIQIARTFGCEVDVLETPVGHAVDPQVLSDRLRRQSGRKYDGILLTQNETSTGVQNDMRALAEVTRASGAITLVDAVSGLGGSDFRMDEWGYDAVVTGSQKVIAAPPGVAMVALSARARERLASAKISSYYFDLRKAFEFAELGQTPWTPPISIIYALDVALMHYHADGAQAVWRRLSLYAQAIRDAVTALGLELLSAPGAHSNTVVAVKCTPDMQIGPLLRKLREERGVVLSGGQGEFKGKIFRIGTMGDISQTDVLGMIGALEISMLEQELAVHIGKGVQAALRVFLEMDAGATRDDAQKTDAQTAAQTMAVPH